MKKTDKYAWIYSDDNEMFFWSKSSTNRYLTNQALLMPKHLIGHTQREKIRGLPKSLPKIFERLGIIRVGFSKKTKDYYQVIGKNNFSTLFIVEDGILPVKYKGKNKLLKKGDVILIPPKSEGLTIQVECGFASIFWAHFDLTWCVDMKKSSDVKIITKLPDAPLLFNLAHSYEFEVYSQNPSLTILENIAQSIAEILKRNLDVSTSKKSEVIEKILMQNIKRKNFLISTIDMAKKLSMDSKELNSFCVSKYSMSYAKFMLRGRMLSALKMLEKGMSVALVSSTLAYANPYVFSRSFKKYFGYSPSEHTKMNIKR